MKSFNVLMFFRSLLSLCALGVGGVNVSVFPSFISVMGTAPLGTFASSLAFVAVYVLLALLVI
jgi:hypothetical protein